MDLNSWLAELSVAYQVFGAVLDDSTRNLLLTPLPYANSEAHSRAAAHAKEIVIAFLFHKAQKNDTFGPVERIQLVFGKTLEDNYGLQSGPFLSLARAYWTFNLELLDLPDLQPQPLLIQILRDVELEIASVFFPTPGPVSMPVAARRAAQRAFLEKYAPGFDIDRFLEENPILQREARRHQSGCLGLLLGLVLA